jgi:hypothetical protein
MTRLPEECESESVHASVCRRGWKVAHLHLWEGGDEVVVHAVEVGEEGVEVGAEGLEDGHVAVVDEGKDGELAGLCQALLL